MHAPPRPHAHTSAHRSFGQSASRAATPRLPPSIGSCSSLPPPVRPSSAPLPMLVDARSSIAFGLVFFIPLLLLILPMLVLVHHLHSSPLLWTLGLALYRTSTSLDERAVNNLKSGASGNAATGVGRGWWWAIWFRGAGREVPRSCQQNRKRATLPSLSQRARSRYWSPRFFALLLCILVALWISRYADA